MQITREMWIGAGVLAFVGTVVLMLPPTTPVAPVATSVRPHARGNASPPVQAPPFQDYAAVAPPAARPAVSMPPTQPVSELASRDPVPSPRWRDSEPAYDGDDAAPDPDFTMGYRWAEANGVFERRDCRRWRGSPAEDGCRAYLRDAEDGDGGAPSGTYRS
jgi:hypothetical protein